MEFTPFLTLLVLTGLCLPLTSTRKWAVLFAAIMILAYSMPFMGVLALTGIAYLIHRQRRRRQHADIRRLPD